MHLSATKVYQDLKKDNWWPSVKTKIVEFIARCNICQQIKIEHQRPAGLLEPLENSTVEVGENMHGPCRWLTS